MEYAFVHTNPTSMPQNKAAIIISAYEGNRVDWGITMGEELRAALTSFQSGMKMLSVITHFLTVVYPPSSLLSPRALSSPPAPRKQREKLIALTHEAWEELTPPSTYLGCPKPRIGTTTTPTTTNTGSTGDLPRMGGGGRHRGQRGIRCHYSAANATSLGDSPIAKPTPYHTAGSTTTASEKEAR